MKLTLAAQVGGCLMLTPGLVNMVLSRIVIMAMAIRVVRVPVKALRAKTNFSITIKLKRTILIMLN
jgi:hypothetical protein